MMDTNNNFPSSENHSPFYDWVTVYQDFNCSPKDIPPVGKHGFIQFDFATNEVKKSGESSLVVEGSYSSTITVRKESNRIMVSGNPSRFSRLDNLFGFSSLAHCVSVFNQVLDGVHPDIPKLTPCTKLFYRQGEDGSRVSKVSDGAYFTRLDVTQNSSVGSHCVDDYLKALSTQPYERSIPNLYSNGKTVDWHSKRGGHSYKYPKCYDKAYEIELHLLPKIKNKYGVSSVPYAYIKRLIEYLKEYGCVRHELEFHAEFLRKNDYRFYGLFNEEDLFSHFNRFREIDKKIGGNAMSLESISSQLLSSNVVDSTRAAHTTSMYAIEWMMGKRHDFSKTQVRTHRARLRKIGIDISLPCDISRFTPVKVVATKEIVRNDLEKPDWYRDARVV